MNESLTGLMIIFSEIGAVIFLACIVLVVIMVRRQSKDRAAARQFVGRIRADEQARKARICEFLKKVGDTSDAEVEETATAIVGCEKTVYSRVMRMFLHRQRQELAQIKDSVENVVSAYCNFVDENMSAIEKGVEQAQASENKMREQLQQVMAQRDKIQKDLDEAMTSMQNMLNEYTQMYSGGADKRAGVKHLEDELNQLKRKLGGVIDLDANNG